MTMNFQFLAVFTRLPGECFTLGSKRLKIMLEIILHHLCCNQNPFLLVEEREENIQLEKFLFLLFCLFVPAISCLNTSYIGYFDINLENFIKIVFQ